MGVTWSRRSRLAQALIVGAALNLIFTAVCVIAGYATTRSPTFHVVTRHGETFLVTHDGFRGLKRMCLWRAAPPPNELATITVSVDPPPSWARIDARTAAQVVSPDPTGMNEATYVAIAYGAPLPAFKGGILTVPWATDPVQPDFGPVLPDKSPPNRRNQSWPPSGEPRTLPITPVFPGIVVNSLLFAAAWWAHGWIKDRRRADRFLGRSVVSFATARARAIGALVRRPQRDTQNGQ